MLSTTTVIALMETKGIGRKTVARLQQMLSDDPTGPRELHDLISLLKEKYPHTRLPSINALQGGLDRAKEILRTCTAEHIHTVLPEDESFPAQLRHIPNPPPLLFYRGDLTSVTQHPTIAIVGTRSPSEFGKSCSRRLGEVFAHRGFTVVSGLALGCDVAAQIGCLETGGTTAAILAHGLDTVHPRQHQKIADRLLRKGGCLLSEYPPGTPPRRNQFVLRNRLQSGASGGTIIIETATEGGTMHTARFAIAQGRALGCLRPQNGDFGASVAGNQLLLREEGAFPLGSMEEIDYFIESIHGSEGHMLTSRRRPNTGAAYSIEPSVVGQLSFFHSK